MGMGRMAACNDHIKSYIANSDVSNGGLMMLKKFFTNGWCMLTLVSVGIFAVIGTFLLGFVYIAIRVIRLAWGG